MTDVSLGAPAASYVRDYLAREGKTDAAVRVAAVRTHCMGGRGYGYSIEEDSAKPGDTVVESEGLSLLVDKQSMQYLKGARIDYEEALQGGGLVVRNPNAVGKCHCGRHDIFDGQEGAEAEGC
ncbi:MAG: iron-sulfur cluster assembly accessory protein [Nitrososphaerota archaeon]|nr:iron-sulfur cluster assembly accessory protein [Nitrososphaerota archaeon]MDG6973590.1 iron-sulfur cluster assembly accessory protein [Nitrososphaerota archaeon]